MNLRPIHVEINRARIDSQYQYINSSFESPFDSPIGTPTQYTPTFESSYTSLNEPSASFASGSEYVPSSTSLATFTGEASSNFLESLPLSTLQSQRRRSRSPSPELGNNSRA